MRLVLAPVLVALAAGAQIAYVGDSLTFGATGHGQSVDSPPAVMQRLLQWGSFANHRVVNLGHCGLTMTANRTESYQASVEFDRLMASTWDIVIVLLGTNEGKYWDVSTHSSCLPAMATTLADDDLWSACSGTSFVRSYLEFLELLRTRGRGPAGPSIFVSIPPPQTLIGSTAEMVDTLLPRLIPLIASHSSVPVHGIIDHFMAFGGFNATDRSAMCKKVVSTAPPCSLMCNANWCDGIHPTDAGYRIMGETAYNAIAPMLLSGWLPGHHRDGRDLHATPQGRSASKPHARSRDPSTLLPAGHDLGKS